MTKQELFRKLTSRKLWAVASVATYIVTEGRLDAEGIKKAVESVQEAVEAVEEMEDGSKEG